MGKAELRKQVLAFYASEDVPWSEELTKIVRQPNGAIRAKRDALALLNAPKYDSQQIASAIARAVEKAKAFSQEEDGGTCNFDAAFLSVPGMTEQQAEEIAKLAGVRVWVHTSEWAGRILQITGGLEGQGMRRTKMAEAIEKSLKAEGFKTGMWYQMD